MTTTNQPEAGTPAQLPKEIQEIAFTLAVKQFDPSMLTEQFVKFSGIIPNEWELARQPVANKAAAQLVFKNGVSIVAQPKNISFLEAMNADKQPDAVVAAQVANTFAEKLPNADYQAVTISPKTIVPLPEQVDGARKFITERLLADGSWKNFGKASVRAGVDLLYQFESCQLNLKVNQAVLQIPEQQSVSALLFSGNFNYRLANPEPAERIKVAKQVLDAWQSDLETFSGIIHEHFLAEQTPQTVFG